MDRWIVDLDNLTICFDCVGNVNRLLERAHERLGDGCFAVARRAINEDGTSRVRRRTEPADDIIRQNQMRQRVLELFNANDFIGDCLFLHLSLIDFQRHGDRADIFATTQRLAGALFAGVGERVAHDVVIFLRRPTDFHQRFFLGEVQKLFDDPAGEFDLLG